MWRNWKPTMPRVEVPEISRCCFCLPLRHGLMVWGYVKMLLLGFVLAEMIAFLLHWNNHPTMVIFTVLVCVDIVFNVMFIVAGHLKHRLLYLIYYRYSLVVLFCYLLFVVWFFGWNWFGYYHFSPHMVLWLLLEVLTSFLPIFFIQGYVTLLVRTEVRKLGNNSNFEFVNNVPDATCSLDVADANNANPARPQV